MFNVFGNSTEKTGARGESLPEANEGLPDSSRPHGLCPRCGKQSTFEFSCSAGVTFGGARLLTGEGAGQRDVIDQVSVLLCRGCGQGTVVVEEQWTGDAPSRGQMRSGRFSYRGVHWWPLPQSTVSPDVPVGIGLALAEAVTALSANCPRAAAVMARLTLEAVAADKGETDGTLAARLDRLVSAGVLQPTLAAWAKEVRLIGNAGAHYDPIDNVSREDAAQLIDFVQELMKYLYELPAQLERRRTGSS